MMRWRAQAAWGAAAAVAAIAAAGLLWWRGHRVSVAPLRPAPADACAEQRSVRIEASSAASFDKLSAAKLPTASSYRLTLAEAVVAAGGGETLVRFALDPASLEASAPGSKTALFSPTALVIYGRYDRLGTLVGLYVDAGQEARSFDALKAALSAWQATRSDEPVFEVVEPDGVGLAAFRYERREGQLEKRKIAYPRVFGGGLRPRVIDSRGKVELDAHGLIASIAIDEKLAFDALATDAELVTHWQASVTASKARQPSEVEACAARTPADAVRALALDSLAFEPARALARTSIPADEAAVLKKIPVATRIGQLPSNDDPKARQEALEALARHLELELDQIPLVEAALYDAALVDAQSLIGVLADVDAAAAQSALLRIMRALAERGQDELLIFAMRQHVFSPHSAAANVHFMLDVAAKADDLRAKASPALLAATAAGSKLGFDERGELLRRVQEDFQGKDELTATLLAALGNLADHRVFQALTHRVMGKDQEHAAIALDALTGVPGDDVERFLISIAASNAKTVQLRKVAFTALANRELSAKGVQDLVGLFPKLVDRDLRQVCLEAIMAESSRYWPSAHALRCKLKARSDLSEDERALLGTDPC
jgi:hypothetical protein